MDKDKEHKEMLIRIRDQLAAILAENESHDSNHRMMKTDPTPKHSLDQKDADKTSKPSVDTGKSNGIKAEESSNIIDETKHSNEMLPSTSIPHISKLVESSAYDSVEVEYAKTMDEDIQKMHTELGQSYELFKTIGEKLESTNFGGLKSRIHDLNLNLNNDNIHKMKKSVETGFLENNLKKLTSEVSGDFRRHPGEFGDIPELSTFFQACAQLEHGLDRLKQQRKSSRELERRICGVTEMTYSRLQDIRNTIGKLLDDV